jgi:energy-coupling factor transporter ATP-binding protein EcfA2
LSNYFEIVEAAFREILASGLSPFVKREMKAKYGANWVTSEKISLQSYHVIKGDLNWSDMQAVLKLIINQWNDIFKQKLGYSARGYVSELIEVRNNLKHESRDTFDFDYSHRALDSIERLLSTLPNDHIAESKAREATDKKKELLATLTIASAEKADKKTEGSNFRWHEICGVMLLQKQRDSLRRKATQVGAEVNVYVALDLLKKEERSRNDGNSKPDKESKKVTYAIDKTFKHDDFLESLTQRQGKNKHIAIAGEAGAGKTTLLATIAEKLHQQGQLTIFISLADLQDKSLYDDIYESWLPRALGLRKGRATEEQKDDLHEQFKLGKVWLLLDGLDEMQSKSSTNALARIESEIGKVLEQSKVLLTCRLNVWDVNLNGLSNFETFRMGKFSQDDVDKFISEWFIKVERPESALILQAKLNDPNRDRIRDMVRHPLRLALLCQAFYLNPNTDLPETKAGLYDRFVPCFYEWKPNIVDEPLLAQDTLRNELHLALGKLAIACIDSDAGFRLSRSLAVKEMGDRLFKLASDLGWLTLERDEQDREIYAFYHATFQEYFAALAINEQSFFLENKPDDVISGCYQIFESKWLEVALFWIGIDSKARNEKNKLIGELAEFKENNYCFVQFGKYFYGYQSIALAARLMAEYIDCSQENVNNVMWQLCQYSFGCFDDETQSWIRLPFPIQECAKQALINSNHARVKDRLDYVKKLLLQAIEGDPYDIPPFLEDELSCFTSHSRIGSTIFRLENMDEDEIVEFLASIINEINHCLDQINGVYVYTRYKSSDPIESNHKIDTVIKSLIKIDFTNPKEIIELIDSIRDSSSFYQWFNINPYLINYCVPKTTKPSLVRAIVNEVSKWTCNQTEDRFADADCLAYHFLWRCSELMNYRDFYESWHPESFTQMPTNKQDFSYLESQLLDCDAIQEKLDLNTDHPEIRCLVVDIHQLEQESDPNVITKKLTNKIFNSIGRRIPVVQDISCLERELLNLKFELGFEKLAIALYGKSANEAIAQLCQNLSPIQTRLFTGRQTAQELITQINAWLSEM